MASVRYEMFLTLRRALFRHLTLAARLQWLTLTFSLIKSTLFAVFLWHYGRASVLVLLRYLRTLSQGKSRLKFRLQNKNKTRSVVGGGRRGGQSTFAWLQSYTTDQGQAPLYDLALTVRKNQLPWLHSVISAGQVKHRNMTTGTPFNIL